MVPCGKCAACRRQRANEWTVRIVHEMASYEDSVFLTLTYDDERLPADGNVDKAELAKFWKRLRKRVDPRKIKYYACGEYGSLYGRPHYHAIVFGLSPCGRCPSCNRGERGGGAPRGRQRGDCKAVVDSWPFGFVQVDSVSPAAVRYVCGYIEKALYTKGLKDRARPFALMSKGIGREYAERHYCQLVLNRGVTVDGHRFALPKYYAKRVFELPTVTLQSWAEEREKERSEHYMNRYHSGGDFDDLKVLRAIEAHYRQSERNSEGLSGLKERDYEV